MNSPPLQFSRRDITHSTLCHSTKNQHPIKLVNVVLIDFIRDRVSLVDPKSISLLYSSNKS
jgi:hypothetical protein